VSQQGRQVSVSRWYAGRIRGTGRRWRNWPESRQKLNEDNAILRQLYVLALNSYITCDPDH
jgi:hypothetical protein